MKNNYKNFNFLNYIAAVILVILCIVQIVPDTSVKAKTAENTGDITEIHTAAELVKASENQTGSYRLMADIDMTGIDWTPWDFSGKFDGNGYTILNLSVTKTNRRTMKTYDGNRKEYDTYGAGLFGILSNADVSGLNIKGARIEVATNNHCFAAPIAGLCNNSDISDCIISDSYVSLTDSAKMWGTGGIAGFGSGNLDNVSTDVTLVCIDTDKQVKDEQFMGGAYAAGFLNIRNCKINIDGYDSDHGYVHDGGLVGMYMVYPYDLSLTYAGEVLNNEVYGQITFYEDNTDRRAYCKANMGEVMNWTYAYSGFKYDFDANETFDYSVTLLPEKCDNPVYNDTVTEPTVTDFGFTTHTCQGCGYTYNDKYTIYKEYKDDSEEVTSPDNDMNMSDDSFGVTKKKDNHVIHVLVVILLTVVMILLIVRYIQVRNQRKRRRRHRRR